jgi:hypothetical protein
VWWSHLVGLRSTGNLSSVGRLQPSCVGVPCCNQRKSLRVVHLALAIQIMVSWLLIADAQLPDLMYDNYPRIPYLTLQEQSFDRASLRTFPSVQADSPRRNRQAIATAIQALRNCCSISATRSG